ncbi:ABC transporter ATP-binding protein [Desulfoluna spongiiphila]|uniref:ABC transporter ATP-binding protein n=1 Tax=Desulfoluna spongiiphila TaxID=419481 RepID=UPI00125AFFFF|nr:ABC transporter ATP-binding protein [Desulfoluna spongiiphila]VVS94547.1 abc transporter type 1 transmembrane domain [Desulfoluna spongiiphila]
MLTPVKALAGNMRGLALTISLNILHLMLNGAPYGMLFLILHELLQPRAQVNTAKISMLFAGMVLLFVANILLAMKVHTKAFTTAYTLAAETRLTLGEHIRKLSMGFFKKRDPGDITSLLLQDMTKVEMIFSHFIIDALSCVVLPLLMAVFFASADLTMTGLMLGAVFTAIPALLLGQRIITRLGKKHLTTRNTMASRILEYLHGINVLKAFNLTGDKFKRLDSALKRFKDESITLEAAAGGPVIVYVLVLELGFIGLLLLGVHRFTLGGITLPVLLIFLVLGYKFFEPLIGFGFFVSEMRYMTLAAERVTDVLTTAPLPEPQVPRLPTTHDIVFEDVRFGYNEAEVLQGISLTFPEKSITALVGPSGSGKTTITHLIPRFWDVTSGSITIGGIDHREIPGNSLHAMISMVFQDVYLFQDTIFNNIRVGKKDATRDEVIAAAKTAQCHGFITGLDDGYDTRVGEGGATLSGGEKQRISIARAILKDAPIVLLDEATASLDPENECLIQEAIGNLVRSKTLVVIAHRLSTIQNADNILVIDGGRVVEKGAHKQLLRNGHVYRTLWLEQQTSRGWKFGSRTRHQISA